MPLNILAWNNKIGPRYYFVGLRPEVMINMDSWGYSYCAVRGEILEGSILIFGVFARFQGCPTFLEGHQRFWRV